jgi:eukaryotic-like serine/threonine-protein kinase
MNPYHFQRIDEFGFGLRLVDDKYVRECPEKTRPSWDLLPHMKGCVLNTSLEIQPKKAISKADFEFVRSTPLFNAIPQKARLYLFYAIEPMQVPAGSRFIRQGEEGDSFYIIRNGSCVVNVERDGLLHRVAVVRTGHTVGEMAVVTGESRRAHVDAQTDMELWRVDMPKFEAICSEHPELRHIITEIVTSRLDINRVTDERFIGKYVISEVIARGGAAIVYKGAHTVLNLPVAIKMLKHKLAMNDYFLEQIQKEAKVIASLKHDNIVRVYDIEQLYRTIFIVMEYLDGVTLDALLKTNKRLSFSHTLNIILQICAGLSYAHKQGIVHRDIKPANIILQGDDTVKILDFGLAAPPGTIDSEFEGTPYYASPDQIALAAVDERSDIYSLGIVCYRMLTGDYPFKANDPAQIFRMHMTKELPDPRALIQDLPDEFCIFLRVATEKDPSQRYQNVDQIIRELAPLIDKLGVSASNRLIPWSNTIKLRVSYRKEQKAAVRKALKDFARQLEELDAELQEID